MLELDLGRWRRGAVGLLLGGLLPACQTPAQVPNPSQPVTQRQSDRTQRRSVAVTVYNQNFGLVHDRRRLDLARGKVELAFKDVSAHIQPETVRLHGATPGARLDVLEQDYRYDLLTPSKLLEKYVGRTINVYRYDPKTGAETKKTAEVLSVEGGVTLRIDGEVTSDFHGRFAFPEVPRDLLEKPTLVWLLTSDRVAHDVEVTYLTQNLNWRADYVLQLDDSDTRGNLSGWVTLDNRSGASYENATLRLVAGDVNRAARPRPQALDVLAASEAAASDQATGFREQGLFEYHLYTLERPTNLLDKETKQVALLSAENVAVTKQLVLNGDASYYRGRYEQLATDQKLGVFVELTNSQQNRLGLPLPKGVVRLYKTDRTGALQFLGEDAIEHTPRDEKLRLKVGDAFDVVADRVQTAWNQLDRCVADASFEIELRNHKSTDAQVMVNEPVGGDWEVLQHDQPFVKVDAATLRFDVKVPARSSSKLTYRVRVRYC
jgi:hypothetical protein